MRKKICDFIYLDAKNYISLGSLKVFYWGVFIIPFMMCVIGIVSIKMAGVSWKSLFPLVSIGIWSLLYWTFVLILQSKHIKKTFALRFLVNGIAGLFISSLFWIFFVSFNIASDTPFLKFDFFLWILFFYLLFTVLYIAIIIFGVHKGIYGKIKEKSQSSKKWRMIMRLSAVFLPVSGVCGMYTERLLRANASVNVRVTVGTIGFILLIFVPGLANINFVQYYYCKKHKITCDEDGEETSPNLEKPLKKPKKKTRKNPKKEKKKLPLLLKILIVLACIPVAIFLLLVIIGIIINL